MRSVITGARVNRAPFLLSQRGWPQRTPRAQTTRSQQCLPTRQNFFRQRYRSPDNQHRAREHEPIQGASNSRPMDQLLCHPDQRHDQQRGCHECHPPCHRPRPARHFVAHADHVNAHRWSSCEIQPRFTSERRITSEVAVPPPNVRFASRATTAARPARVGRAVAMESDIPPSFLASTTSVKRFDQTYEIICRMPRARTRSTTVLPALDLRVKLWFEVDGRFAIGEGGFELLRAITETPLTTRRAGKGGKRGLDLTDAARDLLQRAAVATKAHHRLRQIGRAHV